MPTSTPTVPPTATPTPTNTPTITPTPTATPTATATPVAYACTGCPLAIPDDITTPLTSSVTVPDTISIRELKVFVWITHEDVYDLRVELIAPNGSTYLLYADRDVGGGPDELRTRYTVSGGLPDTANGTWTLRVTDTKPGKTGTLESWNLEIYP
ncbi:hypothetical protein ARMA_1012 [Ardenticatena maritima]|uniref:P/Homo B domain-containing protein n=1 Tax=Ardenticatena maritima TaxID=872965 RepID=A0A0M8K8F0_9CHLR|nr:hypothetical protein ARMA_1012 [Ardenticatena maritima]